MTIPIREDLQVGDICNIVLCVATIRPPSAEGFYGLPGHSGSFLKTISSPDIGQWVGRNHNTNIGVVPAYQFAYEETQCPVLCYAHDDVEVHDHGWDDRVLQEFADPRVAIVGFGGAVGIGLSDLYKTRYRIENLQRTQYCSNQTDWEIHGARETGARDVAVVDGFFMAVRRTFLDEIGGWKWFPFSFHCYDVALCLMAIRRGWKIRMVGVGCTHYGGGTSTTPEYITWCRERGTTPEREHSEPHQWLYREFVDVLPYRVKP